ncbi:hypothetical protein J2795_002827 [Chryseobacterium bernardetii]|uniref:Uncharacterized protein n=1 Tax=Chryseobacterium bernardetii TaxID=1241978 RepID=A0ACC6IWI2_9FLAO|nr:MULTISPECIES: hypothetical protein [Chryseobacterium]MDR6371386.1 hypothetical protein [Chryseobacterium vietnamense]MDR6442109.1 hypothetical protein [Chryseobacterium bernardetii]
MFIIVFRKMTDAEHNPSALRAKGKSHSIIIHDIRKEGRIVKYTFQEGYILFGI